MRRLLPMIALAVAVVATGCAGDDGTASPTDGATATEAGTLTGTLAGDAQLEGGCIWLEPTGGPDADIGDQVLPLFPQGYTIEFDPDLRVLGPDGDVVAERGDELVLDGAPADDVATTCQTGVPYRVDEVLGFVGR